MFKPLAICLGLKQTKISFFVRLVARSSQAGIALGVVALVLVMSVMNGFKSEMIAKFLESTPHIQLLPTSESSELNTFNVANELRYYPLEAAIMSEGHFLPVRLAATKTTTDKLLLTISNAMAEQLNLKSGVKAQIVSPNPGSIFSLPKIKTVTVNATDMPVWQANFAYINYNLALDMGLINTQTQPNISLMLNQPMQARTFGENLQSKLNDWQVITWESSHKNFFQLIATQKSMMFLVLFLIIVIAGFGLISGQVMLVQERRSEIAILITLGFAPNKILFSYFLRGFALGVTGLTFGLLLGYIAAMNVTSIVNFIEYISGHAWLSHALYGMDHMPSKILFSDLSRIFISGLVLCIITPIYPSYLASRSEPIKLLRQQG